MRWTSILIVAALVGSVSCPVTASADENTLKIGVLTDLSGLYSDLSGEGTAYATEMAVADFGGTINGKKIVVVRGDHLNKPDVATSIAQRWFDAEGVDVIVNAAGSSVAPAVANVAKARNKVVLISGTVTNSLSQENCTPNHVHYGLDNYALVTGTVSSLLAQGKKTWYFVLADYAFGHTFLKEATTYLNKNGGKVVGSVKHPLSSSDFSSYVLQAQASKAQVVALANAAADTVNSIAQAKEFGLSKGGQDVAAMILFITDVHAMGLERAQNTTLTTAFYWDLDSKTREFSKRFNAKIGRMPTFYQGADYSVTMHFLKTAQKAGWTDGAKVVAAMKNVKIDDFYARGGYIRDDGVLIHDIFRARVKTPEESKGPWDYYEILETIPGEKAFQSLAETRCPLLKKN